ncbi:MAG TPA: M48 family metalloprotease [Gemmatimonadales bacterium]
MASMKYLGRPALLLLGSLTLATCATNPATGKKELSFTSESQEIQIGKENAAAVKQQMGVYNDPKVQNYVSTIGKRLASETERPNLPWEFTVMDDPVVNAFALPGGYIFITRGILTHMNSEAEMATVVGHEIGHVTARHSVQQMTRQQIAQVGLMAGAIASKEVASHINDLSQGLGVLFLKYGRDAESQADALGFKYALNDGYDVRKMVDMFQILERVSGGSKIPEWQSTHPDPGNRIEATEARLSKVTKPLDGTRVNRDEFLAIIDGMVFGDDPRKGYFEGGTFIHPGLAFALDFPSDWATQNTDQAVGAISPNKDAILELTAAGTDTPEAAIQKFLANEKIQAGQPRKVTIQGNPAATAEFTAQTDNGQLHGIATFISYNGVTFRYLGYTSENTFSNYAPVFQKSIGSFRKLTDPKALNVQPARVKVETVPKDMTLAEYYKQFPSSIPIEQVAIINGMQTDTRLEAGQKIKRVVGGTQTGS